VVFRPKDLLPAIERPDMSEYPTCHVCWQTVHIDEWQSMGLDDDWMCPACNTIVDPMTMRPRVGQMRIDFE
jgi:hypothetical protein